ncbi:MAG: hypothetical protein ABII27_05280 [bacterium]
MNRREDNSIESDISTRLKDFINDVVVSYITWDIITYFYTGEDEKTRSLEEIADSIGRDKINVLPVLYRLEKQGILRIEKRDNRIFCVFPASSEKFELVKEFVKFAENREGRLKIIYIITKIRMAQ